MYEYYNINVITTEAKQSHNIIYKMISLVKEKWIENEMKQGGYFPPAHSSKIRNIGYWCNWKESQLESILLGEYEYRFVTGLVRSIMK